MASKTTIAQAYVQLIPTAKGFKANIEKSLSGETETAGKTLGGKMSLGMKAGIVAGIAGIGKVISSAITEGAELEQSIGGIETMFKDSAQKMKNLALNAYESAGLSANEYMQQVTMFSASLLQSLKGDTKKAGDYANRAIIDMSDNANKMGTDISLIQNAYQGFAKANYTMLDNLRLGYGGTKQEMARLISDASKMKDVQKELNLTVKDGDLSFGNIINAISVMQKKLNITGTTAKEASETLSGSFKMMSSSWKNLLGQLALGNTELSEQYYSLFDSVGVFGKNLVRMIGQIFKQIPDLVSLMVEDFSAIGIDAILSIGKGFVNGFPKFMSNLLDFVLNIGKTLSKQAPFLIDKGFEMLGNLVDGIMNALPVMIQKIPLIISTFARIITDNMPTILIKGAELLYKFIKGILSAIPTLIANIPQIIRAIYDTIMAFEWLNMGKNIITGFINGIKSMFGNVSENAKWLVSYIIQEIKYLPQNLMYWGKNAIASFGNSIKNSTGTVGGAIKGVVNAVINGVKSLPSQMLNIGKNLVKGLWNGINNMTDWIVSKIKGFGNNILKSIKNFFGIHSPSRVFRDEVGKMLPLGMAKGIENGMSSVDKAMADLQSATMMGVTTDMSVNQELAPQYEQLPYLDKIVTLLIALLDKEDKEVILSMNNREIARTLKEMGVVFE